MLKRVVKPIRAYLYSKLRRYSVWPTWRLIFTSLVLLCSAFFVLRLNNQTALKKYREVLLADQDRGNVHEKLEDLREFTFSHINAGINRPVELVYTYRADAEEVLAKKAEQASSQEQRDLYLEGQKECEARSLQITLRAQCVADYVNTKRQELGAPEQDSVEKVRLPDKALYSFKFNSPRFTFDLAGVLFVAAGFFLLLAIFRMMLGWWVRRKWSGWEAKYLYD
jgi:hypothetical protein